MKNRIGEKHITNEGYTIEIIGCFSAINITIQFNNGVIFNNNTYQNIKNGEIKNPYHKSVFGVGYFGVGKYNQKTHRKVYQTWQNMMQRCYDDKYQERQPTYKGCSVIEEWCNFQVFAKWHEENYDYEIMQGWNLDKDILIKGNKIYSSDTCCFVPQEINTLFTRREAGRGKYPIGVNRVGNKFKATININSKATHLGIFITPKEAFQKYKTAKEKYLKEMAEKWKDQITKPTYRALINYKIEITD